jgi:acetyl-CoA carboxylase carboxyl transferase subunit alpha
MLEYATYSVISPEGCASILWKSAEFAAEAAEAMGITADRLSALGLVDQIIPEPLGGAHRDVAFMAANLKAALLDHYQQLAVLSVEQLLDERYQRLTQYTN